MLRRDYAVFERNQTAATIGTIVPSRALDYPWLVTFGPAYFESYQTWPNTKFVHGFNLGRNTTLERNKLLESIDFACKALTPANLLYWELGNEPDLFKTAAQGIMRTSNYSESVYVQDWITLKRSIISKLKQACPSVANFDWMAPSFAGTHNSLDPVKVWDVGLNADKDIAQISSHK